MKTLIDKILEGTVKEDYAADSKAQAMLALDAIINLEKSFTHAAEVFDSLNIDMESFLLTDTAKYPFEKSFDETTKDVENWSKSVFWNYEKHNQ